MTENKSKPHKPRILAPLEKKVSGDDTLLNLARLHYQEAGLGIEIYANSTEHLAQLLDFRPAPEAPVAVHLPRELNPLKPEDREILASFARCSADRVFGIVLHDQHETVTLKDEYLAALRELNSRLTDIPGSPYLFIEYATGLEFEHFVSLFDSIQDLDLVSACVDIGHFGIAQARAVYSQKHPLQDICSLTPDDPHLIDIIDDIHDAVDSALPLVLEILAVLTRINKPLHLHLHDGHPLSTGSPYGISDHLSFLDEIPIPFEYRGKHSLPLMFGPSGLSQVTARACDTLALHLLSFTLEIHPDDGRLALGSQASLFHHWEDKTNAEIMNHWLSVLLQNHRLLLESLAMTGGNG